MHFIPSVAVLAATLFPALVLAAPTNSDLATASAGLTAKGGDVIPDSYIVVLKDGISHDKFEAHQQWAQALHSKRLVRRDDKNLTGVNQGFHFGGLFGYSGAFDDDTLSQIKTSNEVDYVEEDKIMVAYDLEVQENPPSWGLGRISSKASDYGTRAVAEPEKYTFDSSAGAGVNVYVLDTGIFTLTRSISLSKKLIIYQASISNTRTLVAALYGEPMLLTITITTAKDMAPTSLVPSQVPPLVLQRRPPSLPSRFLAIMALGPSPRSLPVLNGLLLTPSPTATFLPSLW